MDQSKDPQKQSSSSASAASGEENKETPVVSPPTDKSDEPVEKPYLDQVEDPGEEPAVEGVKQKMGLPAEKEEAPIDPAVLNKGVPKSSVPEGKPWDAVSGGEESNGGGKDEVVPHKPDFGTPWQPKQDTTGMDLPKMEMPTQKIAAVNFDKPALVPGKDDGPKRRRGGFLKKIFKILLFLLPLGLVVAVGVLAYQVTYQGKTYGQKELEETVATFILELPFTPKTPKYVLGKMMTEMENVGSMDFDVSMAIGTNQVVDLLGTSDIEMSVKGDAEVLDEGKLRGSFRVDVTREFQADIRATEEKVYVKINKLLPTVLDALGDEGVMMRRLIERRWFYLDVTELDSEAGGLLDQYDQERTAQDEFEISEEMMTKLLSIATLEEGDLSGTPVQIIHFDPSEALIQEYLRELWEKAGSSSDYYVFDDSSQNLRFSDVQVKFYIDELYRMRQLDFAAEIRSEGAGSLSMPLSLNDDLVIRMSAVLKMDSFNKKIIVEEPVEALSAMEFFAEITGQDVTGGFFDSSLPMVLGEFDEIVPEVN